MVLVTRASLGEVVRLRERLPPSRRRCASGAAPRRAAEVVVIADHKQPADTPIAEIGQALAARHADPRPGSLGGAWRRAIRGRALSLLRRRPWGGKLDTAPC